MEAIQKIKREIERRMAQLRMSCADKVFTGKEKRDMVVAHEELMRLLSLIKSLEKESDMDLEKEYNEFVISAPVYSKLCNGIVGKAIAKHFYELGLNSKSDAPKIKGWLARDRNKALFFHREKPHRYYGDVWRTDWVMHPQPELHHLRLLDGIMPNLKWEDDPIEVELIIHKIK